MVFEVPVPTLSGMTGDVVGSSYVGAGQTGKRADKLFTLLRRRQIAAIDQQIAIRIERLTPALDLVRFAVQVRLIQRGISDPYGTIAAMGDDMNRIQIAVPGQMIAYLCDTVPVSFQHHHLELAVFILPGEQIVQ